MHDRVEDVLDALAPPSRASARASTLRAAADLIQLWTLCDRAACKRGRCCRRAPSDCLARFGHDAPLRAAALAQLKARRRRALRQ